MMDLDSVDDWSSWNADDTNAWENMGDWQIPVRDWASDEWADVGGNILEGDDIGFQVSPSLGGYEIKDDDGNTMTVSNTGKVELKDSSGKIISASDAKYNTVGSGLWNQFKAFAASPAGKAALAGTALLSNINKPSTGGWKGSIPSYTAIREQVEQPEYSPYSRKAVMGGKFFTDTKYVPSSDKEGIAAAQADTQKEAARLASVNPVAPTEAASPLSIAQQRSTAVKAVPMSPLLNTYPDVLTVEGLSALSPSTAPAITSGPQRQSNKTQQEYEYGRRSQAMPGMPVANPPIYFQSGIATKGLDTPNEALRYSPTASPHVIAPTAEDTKRMAEDLKFLETAIPAASGGLMDLGRYLAGPTDGMADKIPSSIDGEQPARLSHGEFVIPADVVSHLGNGNSDAGADQLYKMMDRVRKDRTGSTRQGKQINPENYFPGGIAYDQGGVVGFQTGGDTALSRSASTNPLGASQETNLAPWVGDYAAGYLGKAAALANQPYEAYQGPLSAGVSPLQAQAFDAAGAINPQATFDVNAAKQYMNPFVQMALEPQLDEMRRQADISRVSAAGRLAKAGAFGGGRQAIMESELLRNLGQQQALTTGKAYETAFDKAMNQYNVGRQQTLADVGALAGLGAQERAIEQQGIEQLRGEFEKQRQFPYEQVKFQQQMLQGLPVGSTTVTPNQSPLSNLMLTTEQVTKLSDWLSKNVFHDN